MGFFKKAIKSVGGFFKKTAGTIAKTALGGAATIVGGPAAGIAVTKAIGLLGETKVGQMAAKVISDGVVKTDKVESTLKNAGINTDVDTVQTVINALKNSASGIANKNIGVTSGFTGGVSASGSVASSNVTFMDKVKGWYYTAKIWIIEHKKAVLIGLAIMAAAMIYFFGFGKRKKWRI
nr:hypothetical protein [uncultured Draconibacterium sp.]